MTSIDRVFRESDIPPMEYVSTVGKEPDSSNRWLAHEGRSPGDWPQSSMECEVEYTDEFEGWWNALDDGEQELIAASVGLLEPRGVELGFPHSSGIKSSRHGHVRELRVQHRGEPYRVIYAFDSRRTAILLIGGCKTGDDRWYEKLVPEADELYDEHLRMLERERKE